MKIATGNEPRLSFAPVTIADIPAISRLLPLSGSRSCDYSIGGIYMWIPYFHYEYCIYADTLFIRGMSEYDDYTPAFSLPIGALPMSEAVALLREYCDAYGMQLRFSAIPADRLPDLAAVARWNITPLDNWADYIYDIASLATLSGKKLAKKRNHVNRFMSDHPGARLLPLTHDRVADVISAWQSWQHTGDADDAPMAVEERQLTLDILNSLDAYPFESACLVDADDNVVAFTVGEIIGDTLYIHIEKMNHEIAGAGETINCLFAKMMLEKYPGLRYVNREDDSGDEGLRRAKESYHPTYLLDKYELTLAT